MTPPAKKVDMAQMNAAIDEVLVIPARPKPAKQNRTQRKDRTSSSVGEAKAPYWTGKR